MEKNLNNMEQLFKKKFEQFQPPPPESVWNGVKSGIPAAPAGMSTTLFGSKYFLPLAVAFVIIIIGAITLPTIIKKNDIGEPELNAIENFISEKHPSSVHTDTENEAGENISDTEINNITSPLSDFENQQTISDNLVTQQTIVQETTVDPLQMTSEENQDPNLVSNNDATISINRINTLPSISSPNIDILKQSSSIELIRTNQAVVNYGPMMSSKWDLGLFYFREWIYYPEDKDIVNPKNSRSFELSGRYHFSEFFIQSGLGLAISEDDGDCRIDYKEYELTGTYEDVYEVTFDSTNQGMVPIFHTQTIEVYDTIKQHMYTPMGHKYTYIQIPVLFGYEQSLAKRFFYNVKLGPLVAIMIGDKESDIEYPSGDLDITNVQIPLPTRIKTSWQFMFGVGMGYNISNHISFSVEPVFKYYLGSGYKSTDMLTKHPYSVGLRGGFIFRF